MRTPKDKVKLSLAEKQILDNPRILEVFLYVLVPVSVGFNIHCTLSGRFLASAVLNILLSCFVVILISIRNALPGPVRMRIFRYVFSFQILIFALYLIYAIGILQQFEVSPWAFLFVLLLFLWIPNRLGGLIAIVFNLALLLPMVWPDPGIFMGNFDYLVRFFSSLALFSLLSFFGVMVRRRYVKKLFQTQAELKASEAEYRNLSQQLLAEIAHRDQIEKKLHHAIKMETVGKVAAGVAHDLNNILSGIVTYPDLILMGLKKQDPLRGPIEMIKESGIKAATIVDDLLTLSRRGVPVSTTMDIKQISEEYLHSPEFRQLKANHARVTLATRYDPGPMTIKGSPVHLSKALMNLVVNAAEAMPRGGEILVRVQARTLDQPETIKIPIQGQSEIPAGKYVVLSVMDTGVGIEAREIASIFEPFYTRKVMGLSGSGLGMSVVLGTVNDHKGFIQVASVVEQGTRINIFFPACSETQAEETIIPDIRNLAGDHKKILVIDDMPAQLGIAEKLLTRLGYRVWCCASGEEALAFLMGHTMDLIIIDMIMAPGMGGIETCEQILASYPDQKILFVTGFSDPDQLAKATQLGKGPCLLKPYTLDNMATLVFDRLKRDPSDEKNALPRPN